MRRLVFAIPGDLSQRTGGYGYDRRLIEGLPAAGWEVDHLALGDGFPRPSVGERRVTEAAFAALPDGTVMLIDGLALAVLDAELERHADRLRLVGLCHHPIALETGITAIEAAHFRETERRALSHCRAVVATSKETARTLATDYGVPETRLAVAPPGTDRIGRAKGEGDPPVLLSLALVTRRKGHDLLIAALAEIADLAWTCRIVGDHGFDPEWTATLRAAIDAAGLEERIRFIGKTDDPAAELLGADLFVLPSRHEGYGMAFAEALAAGLPVVACRAGAVPEVVPDGAGILVPVDDVPALAATLRTLVGDPVVRRRMADAAFAVGARLPDWAATAKIVARVLDTVAA